MPESFEKQLSQMDIDHLRCRKYGHALREATLETERGVFDLGLVCTRSCGYEVSKYRDPVTGEMKSQGWYDPAKGYLFKKVGRLNPQQRAEIWDQLSDEVKALGLPRPERHDPV